MIASTNTTITKIWLTPPMSFARIGSSEKPLDAYFWGEKDTDPKGSNKTTIVPAPTLRINAHGKISEFTPSDIRFKEVTDNGEIFHPVCPWYELYGEYIIDEKIHSGPITAEILTAGGFSLFDIQWSVHVENRKSFQMTLDDADRIVGKLTVRGNDTVKKEIHGVCPENATNPLVPEGRYIQMGALQVAAPCKDFPEIRIRITPSKGVNYGPVGLREKILQLINTPGYTNDSNTIIDDWTKLEIDDERLFLNPDSSWCRYRTEGGDGRTQPGSLFSLVQINSSKISGIPQFGTWYSLGIVDDVSDGIITCSIGNKENKLRAEARVVICPQDFAPDRRHIVTLADNFKDRADHRPIAETYKDVPFKELSLEVQDIFDRIFETMDLMNLDIINQKGAFVQNNKTPFVVPESVMPVPLTQIGRQRHRRFVALTVLETIMRENIGREELGGGRPVGYPAEILPIIKMLNKPLDITNSESYNDNLFKNMPALMRDSAGNPCHLTRRQYDLIIYWIDEMRKKIIGEINVRS
jgi:hypothetical protein